MAVRHDVVILKPEALKSGVLLTWVLPIPRDGIRIEFMGDFTNIGINYRNAAITAPISIPGEDGCLDDRGGRPLGIAFGLRHRLSVAVGFPKSDIQTNGTRRRTPSRVGPVPNIGKVRTTEQYFGSRMVAVEVSIRRLREKLPNLKYSGDWLLYAAAQRLQHRVRHSVSRN